MDVYGIGQLVQFDQIQNKTLHILVEPGLNCVQQCYVKNWFVFSKDAKQLRQERDKYQTANYTQKYVLLALQFWYV